MTRCVYLTFHGEYRGGTTTTPTVMPTITAIGEPHESGPRILYPLYILSAFSILVGFVNFPPGFLTGSKKDPAGWQERPALHRAGGLVVFPAVGHATPSWWLAIVASLVAVAGAGAAFTYYFVKVDRLAKRTGEHSVGLPTGSPPRAFPAGHKLW